MRALRWLTVVVVVLLLAVTAVLGPELYRAASEDPLVWESNIAELEERAAPPPDDAVLFVGSSSIRMWDDLAADMAPLPVIQMGFGGAKIADVLHYLDRIVLAYRARAVVIYVGGNDLTGFLNSRSKRPEEVALVYDQIAQQIRSRLPATPVYYVAIKPTTTGSASWGKAAEVNRAIAERGASDPMLRFIDANAGVTLSRGVADPNKLLWDGIHLNRDGYVAWAEPIRERLTRDLP